jgi:hypothetical protein
VVVVVVVVVVVPTRRTLLLVPPSLEDRATVAFACGILEERAQRRQHRQPERDSPLQHHLRLRHFRGYGAG